MPGACMRFWPGVRAVCGGGQHAVRELPLCVTCLPAACPQIFDEIYRTKYQQQFENLGIWWVDFGWGALALLPAPPGAPT